MRDKSGTLQPYSINTSGADMTLELLSNKIDQHDIEVPEFQRGQVWPITKASKLIESFLLGLPVPQIFLYQEPKTQKLLVVDGQQRLMAVHMFFKGIYKSREFRLSGLDSQWNSKTYQELSEPDKRRLRNVALRATIFEQVDPNDSTSIFEVFERLNTGGMTLTSQEVRNAVIGGDLNTLAKGLNLLPSWRKLYGKEQPDDRYRDVELIIRLLALYENYESYKKPMSSFLNSYLQFNVSLEANKLDELTNNFTSTIDLIYQHVGIRAFRLKTTVNVALADALFVGVCRNLNILHSSTRSDSIKPKYNELLKAAKFVESIEQSTTDNDKVKTRLDISVQTFSK